MKIRTKKYVIEVLGGLVTLGYKGNTLWTIILDDDFDEVKANQAINLVIAHYGTFEDYKKRTT